MITITAHAIGRDFVVYNDKDICLGAIIYRPDMETYAIHVNGVHVGWAPSIGQAVASLSALETMRTRTA